MGIQVAPGYIGQSGYNHPVELFRNILKAETSAGKGYMKATTDFTLTPSGAALSLTIGEGAAAIRGLESASQGSYFVWSNGNDVLPWPAASGQPRIDALLLRVIDKQYGTDADANGAQWQIHQGTPAASPSAIADVEFNSGGSMYRPGAWWRVANVLISPGNTVMTSTTITDLRSYADSRFTTLANLDSYKTNTLDSAWTAYVPVWTATSVNPVLGNGTVVGRYKQIGKTVFARIRCTPGSTTTFGTGSYSWSLPVAASVTSSLGAYGAGRFRDNSAGSSGHFVCVSVIETASPSTVLMASGSAIVSSALPAAPANGDYYELSIEYEAA